MVSPTVSDVHPTMGVKIFSAGVSACLADVITFPLDTAKVRLQVANQTQWGAGDIYGTRAFDPLLWFLPPFLVREDRWPSLFKKKKKSWLCTGMGCFRVGNWNCFLD